MTPTERADLSLLAFHLADQADALTAAEAAIRTGWNERHPLDDPAYVYRAVDTNGRPVLADILAAKAQVTVALANVRLALLDQARSTEVRGHDGTVLRTLPDDTGPRL